MVSLRLTLDILHLLTSLFITLTSASPINPDIIPGSSSPLEVSISPGNANAVVTIAVTNTGPKDLQIMNLGTFLYESAAIEKLDISYAGNPLPFKGLYMHYSLTPPLPASAFTALPAGQTLRTSVSLSGLYDFPASGIYTAQARGALSFLDLDSPTTGLPGTAVAFTSNVLELSIDAIAASAVESLGHALERRGALAGCTGERREVLRTAFANARKIAGYAAAELEAEGGGDSGRFEEYFKTSDAGAREEVARRFRAIERATGRTDEEGGVPRYYCEDPVGECKENVIAYTYPSTNTVANCDIFYTLPPLTTTCTTQDQAGTIIHELTHAPGVHGPYCQDHAYGYEQVVSLKEKEAAGNADTFAMFAKGSWLGCRGGRREEGAGGGGEGGKGKGKEGVFPF